MHKSVHKGTELGGWIESPISMENFKQAGEAFDVLSYWGIAEWEDFICDGRNYFCVSRISLVSLFRERAMRRKGIVTSLALSFPLPLQRKLLELLTMMEMWQQPDFALLE